MVEQRTENPRVAGSIPALGIYSYTRRLVRKSLGIYSYTRRLVRKSLGIYSYTRRLVRKSLSISLSRLIEQPGHFYILN